MNVITSVRFCDIQQQYFLAACRHGKSEPFCIIRRRKIKRLHNVLVKRCGAVPCIIIFDFIRREQGNHRRADFLTGAAAQSDVVKFLFVEFPIQIAGTLISFAPNCFCGFPIFCKIPSGITTGRHPSAVRADVQRHVIFRNSKAEPIRIAAV